MLRVGRISQNRPYPKVDGFTNIVVMMKSHSKWWPLSPYYLVNKDNQIMENLWQFSKVYETIPPSTQTYSRYNNNVIWKHGAEHHFDLENQKLTKEYFAWRQKGFDNSDAVRYPVGFTHRHKCLFAITDDDLERIRANGNIVPVEAKLDYVASRKKIYGKIYCDLAKQHPQFLELQKRLANGENLLIIEVDGPHLESLDYYKEKYGVDDSFIVNGTILVNSKNIGIMLNDTKHAFGHGYCLAVALLDKQNEWFAHT